MLNTRYNYAQRAGAACAALKSAAAGTSPASARRPPCRPASPPVRLAPAHSPLPTMLHTVLTLARQFRP
eukprot:759252-Prymnesium_polylepis.1